MVAGEYTIVGDQFSSGGLDFMTFKAPYSQVQLTREMLDKSAQQMNRHIGLRFQQGTSEYGLSADYQSKLQSSASPLVSDSNSSDAKNIPLIVQHRIIETIFIMLACLISLNSSRPRLRKKGNSATMMQAQA